MASYIVNSTASYTLILSTETGRFAVVLADEVIDLLSASKDGQADLLAALGDDATALLEAIGALMGLGDALAEAYANGGLDGLSNALEEFAAKGAGGFAPDGFGETPDGSFIPDGFEGMGADALAEHLGFDAIWGDEKSGEGSGAMIEAYLEKYGAAMEDDSDGISVWGAALAGAGAGGVIGASKGLVPGAILGAAVGGVAAAGIAFGLNYTNEKWKETEEKVKDSVTFDKNIHGDELDADAFDGIVADALDEDTHSHAPSLGEDEKTMPDTGEDEFDFHTEIDPKDVNKLDQTAMPLDPDAEYVLAANMMDHHVGVDPLVNPGAPVDETGGEPEPVTPVTGDDFIF